MPKMKTRRAAAKRFSLTATGKYKRRSAKLRHKLEGRTQEQKKRAGKTAYVSNADFGLVARMLPNG